MGAAFDPTSLREPYWRAIDPPCLDFNREVIKPGVRDTFPEGVVGIRVDDDFWACAALPFDTFHDMPIEQIVPLVWPQYADRATYNPDSPEQSA